MSASRPDWTALTAAEKADAIRPMVMACKTTAHIASHFDNCGRMQVIGAVHRMRKAGEELPDLTINKINGGQSSISIKTSRKQGGITGGKPGKTLREARARRAAHPNDFKARAEDRASDPGITEPAALDLTAPASKRLQLVELTEKTCKWPQGDPQSPEFAFCGHSTDAGPYCGYHSRIAYQPRQRAA